MTDTTKLRELLERLRSSGSSKGMVTGRGVSALDLDEAADAIAHLLSHIEELTEALGLALARLVRLEPGDSRAVSDEFVAMASVHANRSNPECLEIIRSAIKDMGVGEI